MKQSTLILLFLHLSLWSQCQDSSTFKSIDNYLRETIKINEIPGLAVGIIKNNKVIFQQYYGTETLESNRKVNPNSIFRVYSTSKLISTVGVFQLVEKGKISIEDKISKYLANLLNTWQDVKIKNLLTHSSGIPDMIRFTDISVDATDAEVIARLTREKMEFETGDQFRYNQTNYWLLTRIIEKVSGQTFEDFILKNQFPESENSILFSSNSLEMLPNRVVKYNYNADTGKYEKSTNIDGIRAHSANGLAISLPAFLQWSIQLNKGDLLKDGTKKMMWKPFDFFNKRDVFGYGWEITKINTIPSYGFSGGNVSAYRIFPENDLSIIVMSNGYKFFPVQYQIINHIAGLVDKNLIDPYLSAEESIISNFMTKDYPSAQKAYYNNKAKNPKWNFENTLNSVGYTLLRKGMINESIKVFELNTRENPQSGNAFDSLGESYFVAKNYTVALEKYKKAFELDSQNNNAKDMIMKIEKAMNNN
ncbi:serine hydrolase [Chryseobacterium sp. W4I1]|uniref:serine hydrolase n=1 Tax=Chryseobacterium sp. W4I1 TaxID=3042293 RepID=UPI002785B459|nr:serine hydrolase [Chryseobacterium sp. W4I1]MDQ0783689.1 CubicO group peptidase (beta-lactamase class C family) [Chryseobacterium sp. W4I1]